ncbi:MAG TPA: Uma2 family endonuclease [Candidatus Acidoferrales bacterium]|nr:Uma2 family endonuclease [Candidatus Acidoferrales bacterium]
MSTLPKDYLTPEQYLEIERKAEVKSEYFRGEMFAMSGASLAHNVIVANVLGELHQQLRSKPCRVLPSDMRVFIQATGLYTYPDAVVVCGEPKLQDKHFDTLLNPAVILEVLSPSTEAYDRGRKFEHYSSIESLTDYLLVATDRIHADLYTRQPDGSWLRRFVNTADGAIELASIGCRLVLGDLYERVDPGSLS